VKGRGLDFELHLQAHEIPNSAVNSVDTSQVDREVTENNREETVLRWKNTSFLFLYLTVV
jgi:hypothetical protein